MTVSSRRSTFLFYDQIHILKDQLAAGLLTAQQGRSSNSSANEDSVAAWQLDVGQELASENIPQAHIALVVSGSLRVSGRDAMGNPFTEADSSR